MKKIKAFALVCAGWMILIFGLGLAAAIPGVVDAYTPDEVAAFKSGEKKFLAVLVNFTNDTSQTYTKDQVREAVFSGPKSVSAYYNEVSFGQLHITGDVAGYFTIPYANTDCNTYKWGDAAKAMAVASGIDVTKYDLFVYVFPKAVNCHFAGTTGAKSIYITNTNESQIYSHEFGHILGMGENTSYLCGNNAIDIAENCVSKAYGDPYDSQGHGYFHINAAHKAMIGWIPASRTVTATANGNYTIYSLEKMASGPQVLIIDKPNTGQKYYFEYRQPYGFDATLPSALTSGVGIVVGNVYSSLTGKAAIVSYDTARIDAAPGDNDLANSALADGKSFVDVFNGITVTQASHDANSATVKVSFAAGSCIRRAPSVTISPAIQGGDMGKKLTYSVTVKNNNALACPIVSYNLSTVLPAGFYSAMDLPQNLSQIYLASQAAGTFDLVVDPLATATAGDYQFSVVAKDSTSSELSGSGGAIHTIYSDTVAPGVTIISPANGATVSGVVNILANTTDNGVISKVEVYADNVFKRIIYAPLEFVGGVFRTTDSPYLYSWDTASVAMGPHTIVVKAYDGGGNSKSGQISLTVDSGYRDILAPVVNITSPANGALVRESVKISAAATDNIGVARVEFYIDNVLKTTATQFPYSYNWITNSAGSAADTDGNHVLTAKAYDKAGNVKVSPAVNVNVVNTTGVIAIISPDNGSIASGIVTVQTDYHYLGTMYSKIELFVDNVLKTSDAAGFLNWNTMLFSNGPHSLFAKFYNAVGNPLAGSLVYNYVATSPAITVNVNNNAADTESPVVAITSPATGDVYKGTQVTTINADATDIFGVSKVEFYDGTALLGTDMIAPYIYNWQISPADNGSHNLIAKAYDAAGNIGISAPSVVTVAIIGSDTVAPTVAFARPADNSVVGKYVDIRSIATDNVGVVKVELYINGVLFHTSDSNVISLIISKPDGSYNLVLKAYDAAGNSSSAASNITVKDGASVNNPPTVNITSPVSGVSYSTAQTVTVNASASDDTGVSKVEFYDGTALLGSDTTVPYSYSWTIGAAQNGSHSLVAKAYDAAGSVGTSNAVSVTINIPVVISDTVAPIISLSSPTSGTSYTATQTVSINANVTDNVGVTKVEFYDGSLILGTDTASPFSYSWPISSTNNGTHSLIAKAYDAAGNVGTSNAVSAVVNIPVGDTVLPVVSLVPLTNSPYVNAQNLNVNATATDNVGVAKVEFYDGSALLGADTTAPYGYSWAITATQNGVHSLIAKAYDAAGNVGTSAAVSVTINIPVVATDNVAPTVSITAPANNSTISATANITAAATDNVGVSRVELYDGTTKLATLNSAPYAYFWNTNTLSNGPHSLTAKAYDAKGNMGTSPAVSVSVSNAVSGDIVKPTVSIAYPTSVIVGGTTNIIANAADNVGIAKVEFYIAGQLKSADDTWPYEYSWDTKATGNVNQALMVKAYDASNNVGIVSKTLTVSNRATCTSLPAITIISPADGATVTKGQTYTVTANATDPDGIKRIYLYTDSTSLGYCLAGTCSKTWKVPATAKSSIISAHVDDNKYCGSDAAIVVGVQ